ncbi:MAG TPA: cysteine desulfurase [Streptosporangiaceae bacterium]|jgi:cysteine desulfurase/selenocysteine lyase|nr:cysteine desulfurase [Streptosporangiaceae bacterium]
MSLDVALIRKDFPILERQIRGGQPLVYLDSANTSQKPRQVIDALGDFYERHNANIHRASHQLGEEATEAYEGARIKAAELIGARDETEVVFTKNISEGINLVAYSMSNATAIGGGSGNGSTAGPGRFALGPGDEVVITEMEHHSNIVPWQLLCQRTGATLRWFGVTPDGRLDISNLGDLITERTKLVALVHQSNVLGTINPVRMIADAAHAVGALVLVDAAQSVPHMPVDVTELGADFLGFTGHKMCGPTGIGVLWARAELLAEMPPFLGGGEMIESVWMDRTTFAAPPHKFEAGTMPIAQAVGLGAAIDYLSGIGLDAIRAHEERLISHALAALTAIDGVRILGPADPADPASRGSAISFTVDGVHPHDVSQVLDDLGIAVRAGHHCAWPLHRAFGVQSSTRASFYLYNTLEEADALAGGIRKAQRFFAR